jgi:hypothetical protein
LLPAAAARYCHFHGFRHFHTFCDADMPPMTPLFFRRLSIRYSADIVDGCRCRHFSTLIISFRRCWRFAAFSATPPILLFAA